MIARVRVLRSAAAIDRPFDYQVPQSFTSAVVVGSWVRVPFGSQYVQGIVIEFPAKSPFHKLKPIQNVMKDPPLAREQLDMIDWISRRYLTQFSSVAALFEPPAGSFGE